jgi:hypothetical protein
MIPLKQTSNNAAKNNTFFIIKLFSKSIISFEYSDN